MRGKGIPTIGKSPETMAILMKACQKKMDIIPTTRTESKNLWTEVASHTILMKKTR